MNTEGGMSIEGQGIWDKTHPVPGNTGPDNLRNAWKLATDEAKLIIN